VISLAGILNANAADLDEYRLRGGELILFSRRRRSVHSNIEHRRLSPAGSEMAVEMSWKTVSLKDCGTHHRIRGLARVDEVNE
jgi:hypothetical protein